MAAAPYLHARLSTIDAKLSPVVGEPLPERRSITVDICGSDGGARARDDQE